MAYVYKHVKTIDNTTFYIGIGNDKQYQRAYSKDSRNKHWIHFTKKYDYYVEIIETNLSWNEACIKEKYWIKFFGRKDLNEGTLLNLTNGGDGTIGLIHSTEHRQKNSFANKGKKKSPEHIQKMIGRKPSAETILKIKNTLTGKKRTEEERKKISEGLKKFFSVNKNPFFGKKHTEESKRKIGLSQIGHKRKMESIEKMIQKLNKPVNCYTKDGIYVNSFPSIKEAGLKLKINSSHIGMCCRNERKTSGGYIWRFV